jgi:hypothetical protein
MARAALALCMAGLLGCSDGRYVIGRQSAGDAAADGGSGECVDVHQAALVCSGFEPTALTDEWNEVMEGAGELERSTARAHSGQAALHATTRDAMSAAALVRRLGPVRAGELHLRAHLYVPSGSPTEIINVFYVGAAPGPDPFVGIDFNLQDDAVEVFSPQADPVRQTGTGLIPRDRWFCFQARIEVRDEGAVEARVDGVPAVEATDIDTLPPGGIVELRVGIDWSSEQREPFEVYVDDVVLDTVEVACLPP